MNTILMFYKPNGGGYLQLISAKDLYIQNITVAEHDSHSDSFQVKGQLQRFHKLISNDRIWHSEHSFEVIFEISFRFRDIGLQSQKQARDPFSVSLVFQK